MGIFHSPKIVTNNLAFAYDMSNTGKSWKGKPTTNLTNVGLSGMSGITLSFLGVEDGWKKYSMSGTFTGGTYPYIMFVSSVNFTGGVAYSSACYIKTNAMNKFNYFGIGMNYVNQPMNRGGDNVGILQPDGSYYCGRINFIYTNTTTQTGYIMSNPINNTTFNASTDFVWIKEGQIEQGTFATPFAGDAGTRSNTQSLVDITNNYTINASNLTFNSDGSFKLNSSKPDYVDLGSDQVIKTTGGWTVESWVKFDTVPGGYDNVNSPGNFIGSDTIAYNSWYWSVLSNKLALWNISPGIWRYGSTTIQPNIWYQTVLVSDPSGTSYQMYLNGVPEGGDHTTYSWNPAYSGLRVRYMGRGNAGNTRRLNGFLPVTKIYTRALSADEIKQNYNALKGRYGL